MARVSQRVKQQQHKVLVFSCWKEKLHGDRKKLEGDKTRSGTITCFDSLDLRNEALNRATQWMSGCHLKFCVRWLLLETDDGCSLDGPVSSHSLETGI